MIRPKQLMPNHQSMKEPQDFLKAQSNVMVSDIQPERFRQLVT